MKAALISINWKGEEVMVSWLEGEDPILKAEQLKRSIDMDWPEWDFKIIGDEEANEVRKIRILKAMGMTK